MDGSVRGLWRGAYKIRRCNRHLLLLFLLLMVVVLVLLFYIVFLLLLFAMSSSALAVVTRAFTSEPRGAARHLGAVLLLSVSLWADS